MDPYESALSDTLSTDEKNVHVLSFYDPDNCPLYDQIRSDKKTIEGRKYSERYQNIKPGDTILLSDRKKGILECDVTYVNLYADITEYLAAEGLDKAFGDHTKCRNISNVEEGVKLYEEFVSSDDVKKLKKKFGHGFMGIGIKFKHEYKRISDSLRERWFDAITARKKIVEGRLDKGLYANLQPYDMIVYTKVYKNKVSDKKETIKILITKVKRYKSFYEMFDENGLENILPGVETYDDGLAVYREWYSEEKEKELGVVGVFFHLFE